MNNIIEIKNVSKKFGDTMVLNDVHAAFSQGYIHGLIGRNGSGKTMLLKCICGMIPISSGIIKVRNKIIGKEIDIPDKIGVIIETPGFLPEYSAYKNLKFLAEIRGGITRADIESAIEKVGLDPKERKKVGKYSLGMRQRLGLAQAIMENPELLILDEPMNGLDKEGVEDMRKYLLNLKKDGKTILIASHSAEDIDVLCDNVYEMERGRIKKIR